MPNKSVQRFAGALERKNRDEKPSLGPGRLNDISVGRRKPEGPAKALLRIASKNPSAVLDALHAE